MTKTIIARWQEWAGTGLQHLVLTQDAERIVADAIAIVSDEGARFTAHFVVTCDARWRTREVEVELFGEGRRIDLASDGDGNWRDGAGVKLPALAGAIDVDITITPYTNTLPIRRLGLGPGQSAELKVCYIEPPALTVRISPQRYTCLTPTRYRYESLDTGFMRDIEIDGDGLVTIYPDLFRRLF
ncbi:MAG: hypothetical protein FJX35_26165 [Alphaproteobacteria bacterium]|nr:hypothetical protein [Alphaproteobacteria bacterium]